MVRQEKFLNEKALIAENAVLKIICLPEFGGKLVSLFDKVKQKEFLFQNPNSTFTHAETGSDFSDFEACGLDDAFPSIDAGHVLVGDRLVSYPDHGEIWSSSFIDTNKGNMISLSYNSSLLPYSYVKNYSLNEEGLSISYKIKNTGQVSFPYIWTLHCLLTHEEGMGLIFPKDTREVVIAFPSPRFGPQGTIHPFPIASGPGAKDIDFRKIDSPNAPCMEKFYINHKVSEGLCGVRYPQSGTVLWFEYDKDKMPYLGFWNTQGGYRGDFNCALEPTNGFYDSIERAMQNAACPKLFPDEEFTFSIGIRLEHEESEEST